MYKNLDNSNIPYERSVSLNIAYEKIVNEINSHGLCFDVFNYGNDLVATHCCLLSDKQGNNIARGCGKGTNPQLSLIGALFESIEHYLHEYKCLDNLIFEKFDKINKQLHFCNDFMSNICADTFKDSVGGMHEYQNYNNSDSALFPAILTSPKYLHFTDQVNDVNDYLAIKRYASNSGTAIGVNIEEALLHAINESIERDAISLFMIYHFYLKHDLRIAIIDETTLDKEVGEQVSQVKKYLNLDFVIVDVTSEFEIPVFIAVPTNKEFENIPLIGCGASLNKEHALQRAISELAQVVLIYRNDAKVSEDFLHGFNVISKYPKLIDCFRFSIKGYSYLLKDYNSIATYEASVSISKQLDILATKIAGRGYQIYQRTLWQSANVHCVSVIIPELERFFISMSGNPVIPSPEGITRATDFYRDKYDKLSKF